MDLTEEQIKALRNEDDPMGDWGQTGQSKLMDKQIFDWKSEGATFGEIGRKLGFGKERARQRFNRYKELQEKDDR